MQADKLNLITLPIGLRVKNWTQVTSGPLLTRVALQAPAAGGQRACWVWPRYGLAENEFTRAFRMKVTETFLPHLG